jgi:RNA recognition motif-containing protein
MNIYVGNLPYTTTQESLQGLFEEHGTVESVRVITDKITNKSRGFAFVSMPNDDEGARAIQALNNFELEGRSLKVSQANNPQERAPRGEQGGGFRRYGNQDRGGGRFNRNRGNRF